MAPSTPPSNEAGLSDDQFLPPEWESTILIYLLLPGLCAFFLFLLILLVAFRLIKTNKYTSTSRNGLDVGSFIEHTPDTSVYDVISESPGISRAQSYRDKSTKTEPNSFLQVCLPSPVDIHLPKGRGTVQSPLPSPLGLDMSDGQRRLKEYNTQIPDDFSNVNRASLLSYAGNDISPLCGRECRFLDSDEQQIVCNDTKSCNLDRSFIDDPIYESLDKTWIKKCKLKNKSMDRHERKGNGESVPRFCDPVVSTNRHVDSDTMDGRDPNQDNCVDSGGQLANDQSCCNHDVIKDHQSPSSSKPPIYSKTKKTWCGMDQRNFKDYDICTDVFNAGSGGAVCKLSIFIGAEKEHDTSKTKVSHYYYRINAIDKTSHKETNYSWINKFNSAHVFLSSENEHATSFGTDKDNIKTDHPLKLELLKSSSSLVDLTTDESSAQTMNSPCQNITFKGISESCENVHGEIQAMSHKQKSEVKKSQSFKESGKYRKTGRSRKLSLGSFSLSNHKNYKDGDQHKSFDKLEVARILARLGPLPPIPKSADEIDEDKTDGSGPTIPDAIQPPLSERFDVPRVKEISTNYDSEVEAISTNDDSEVEAISTNYDSEVEAISTNDDCEVEATLAVVNGIKRIDENIADNSDGNFTNHGVKCIDSESNSTEELSDSAGCDNAISETRKDLGDFNESNVDTIQEGDLPKPEEVVEGSCDEEVEDKPTNHYFILEQVSHSCCSMCDLDEAHASHDEEDEKSDDDEEDEKNDEDEGDQKNDVDDDCCGDEECDENDNVEATDNDSQNISVGLNN